MLSPLTFLFHEIGTNFEVVAEVALVSIAALPQTLKFVARFDLAFVVGVGTVIRKPALAVDELFADSIGGELVMVSWSWGSLDIGSVIGGVEGARVRGSVVVVRVHL